MLGGKSRWATRSATSPTKRPNSRRNSNLNVQNHAGSILGKKKKKGPSPFRERQGTGALKGPEEICSEGISSALFSPVSSFTSSRNTFLFPSSPPTHSGMCTLEGRYSKRGATQGPAALFCGKSPGVQLLVLPSFPFM